MCHTIALPARFGWMSEGRHIGKLVVNFEGETVQVRSNPEGGG
jgi:hypothetical protein